MRPFNPSPFARTYGGLPQAQLVNMYFETTPTGPGPVSLIQRPGLVASGSAIGTGPIRALLVQNGVFSENLFAVSGNKVYRNGSNLGTISTSTGLCEINCSRNRIVVVTGGPTYYYDGATFAQITDVDLPTNVVSACYYAGRWYYAEKDTSTFYWSAIGDPTTIDGLAFATAEGSADEILNIFAMGDDLVIAGPNSVEFFYSTTDPDSPVARYTNRSFSIGCGFKFTLQKADNTFFFVGTDGVPYRAASVPQALIEPQSGDGYAIVELLSQANTDTTFAFVTSFQGHEFYVIAIPSVATYAYDITTRRWSQWKGGSAEYMALSCGIDEGGLAFMGSDTTGQVYSWGYTTYQDAGSSMTRVCSAFVPVDDTQRADRIRVTTVSAAAQSVDMRWYDTAWSSWITQTTNNGKADWRRLGSTKSPGRHLEFRTTANANVTFAGFDVNPGRP
jgi:hypothetical protein